MNQPVILHLANVSRQFSPNQPAAVQDISLKLQQGDILGLLGPSGCGKTTLLRLIAGFEQPQTGTIAIANQTVAGDRAWIVPERRDVGMVFQDYALFPHMTVATNVAFGLTNSQRRRTQRHSQKQIQKLVQEAIALVGLSGLENRYPHELSGGQQQRVALARALAPQPALVLLDEPLSNLDTQVRLRLRQEVRTILKQTGTSGVFVTHDQEEALSICDRVAVMREGQIEQCDTPEMLYQKPTSRFVAEFVTQANFIPAQWKEGGWETEVGRFGGKAEGKGQKAEGEGEGDGGWGMKMGDGGWGMGDEEGEWGMGDEKESLSTRYSPLSTLMIRQEDLLLEPDDRSSVVIRDRQFLGREHRYSLVSPSGLELYARLKAENPLPIGIRVRLSAAETSIHVFDSDISTPDIANP